MKAKQMNKLEEPMGKQLLAGLSDNESLSRIIELQNHLDAASGIYYAALKATNTTPQECDEWGERFGNALGQLIDPIERVIGRVVYDELFVIRRANNGIQ